MFRFDRDPSGSVHPLWLALFALALIHALACGPSRAPRGNTDYEPVEEAEEEEEEEDPVLRTEADDRRVGEKMSKEVGGSMGIVDAPALAKYVQALGQRLVLNAPPQGFAYEFRIVDQDVPNAFALPGGFIYVSRGLLILSNSEDELANVIGHEITHVAARHAAARQAIIAGMPRALQFFAMGNIASYSRDQEREADRFGQQLSGMAGYDPEGMPGFLKQLEFSERLQLGASRLPGFLDTHPVTGERVAMSSAYARNVPWTRTPGITKDRDDYLRRLEGLVVGTAATEGVFKGERFIHPVMNFMMTFPPSWETRNTRQAVGATSPAKDAVVFLEFDSEGDDPEAASIEYLGKAEQQGLKVHRSQPLQLGEFPGWRIEGVAHSGGRSVHVTLTWIAYQGMIMRLTGAGRGDSYHGTFLNVARSFRPLAPRYRRDIKEQRLHIVPAQAGETLEAFSRRTGNRWDIQTSAVANAVFTNARLEAGQPMKIAVSRDYKPDPEAR